jgi:hypothetical protein
MKTLLVLSVGLAALAATPLSAQVEFGARQIIGDDAVGPKDAHAADIDGDGDPDIIVASQYDNAVSWYENLGGGAFGARQIISQQYVGAWKTRTADIDGDMDLDIVAISGGDGRIAWHANLGGGSFAAQAVVDSNINGLASVAVGDLDGDDDPDVVIQSFWEDYIAWYENLGGGSFNVKRIVNVLVDGAAEVRLADIDGDSDLDILSASNYDDKIAWYANNGSGLFGAQQIISTQADWASGVFAADLDGDSDLDVLSTSKYDNKLAWYENTGGGSFGAQQIISTAAEAPQGVIAADLDIDGDNDVLVVSWPQNKVSWFENLGGGTFAPERVITRHAFAAQTVDVADVDGDGDLDAITASRDDFTIAWHESLRVVKWTGTTSDDWHTGSNWDSGVVPGVADFALVDPAPNQPRVTASIDKLALGGAQISSTASLTIAPASIDTFFSEGNVRIYGTFALEETANPVIRLGGDWTVEPVLPGTDLGFVPGISVVVAQDGAGVSDKFYNLEIEEEAIVFSTDNVEVENTLAVPDGHLVLRSIDTLTISSTDTLAVEGEGVVYGGAMTRAMAPGSGAAYRFESPKTTVRYPGGDEPASHTLETIFTDPETIAEEESDTATFGWIVQPEAILDTAEQIYTIHNAEENGTWTFGFIDSATGKRSPVEILGGGGRFMRRTYRGSSGRNMPKESKTNGGPTLTFRWDKADMPPADPPIEEDWSKLLCFKLGVVTDVEENENERPTRFALEQNYPNPFNPATTVRYALPEPANVRLDIFNTLGERVATLEEGAREAGYHETRFVATGLASGVYFYQVEATTASGKTYREARKMTLIK